MSAAGRNAGARNPAPRSPAASRGVATLLLLGLLSTVALAPTAGAAVAAPAPSATGGGGDASAGPMATRSAAPSHRVVVLWEDGVEDDHRAEVLAAYGDRGTPVGRVDTVEVGAHRAASVARHLDARPEVVAAEPDRAIALLGTVPAAEVIGTDRATGTAAVQPAEAEVGETPDTPSEATDTPLAPRPDDPLFEQQWGLENTGQVLAGDGTLGTPGTDVNARGAWLRTRGSPEVTVAVIDSGIDVTHRDLEGAFWRNPGERADGTDSDGNGFIDDLNGWDFVTGLGVSVDDPTSMPAEQHGTQVAGVIAARADDGFGVAGIAPQVRIMAVRAFNESPEAGGAGQSDIATLVAALQYAVVNGADIINASWESATDSAVLEAAVASAGIPVVAAAGNRGLDLDRTGVAIPAGFDLPNLVAVTAIDPIGRRPAFATFGASTIDVAAPGVGIVTTTPGDRHTVLSERSLNGTSFAVPFVSGSLALARSAAPTLQDVDLVDTLLWTTVAEPALLQRTTTGGRVDAGALLAALERPVCGGPVDAAPVFADVEVASVHHPAIGCLATLQVTLGYGDGTFRPGADVTRGEAASFLARIVGLAGALPDDPPDAFEDDDGSVHEPAINALAALEILRGDEDERVHPTATVTRGQFASMLTRTFAAIEDRSRTPSRPWFPDAAGSVHAGGIDVARDLGLVRGQERTRFEAGATTRRDQLASMLARTLDALARADVELDVDLDAAERP